MLSNGQFNLCILDKIHLKRWEMPSNACYSSNLIKAISRLGTIFFSICVLKHSLNHKTLSAVSFDRRWGRGTRGTVLAALQFDC